MANKVNSTSGITESKCTSLKKRAIKEKGNEIGERGLKLFCLIIQFKGDNNYVNVIQIDGLLMAQNV